MRDLFQLSKNLINFSPQGMWLDSIVVKKNDMVADITVSIKGTYQCWRLKAIGQKKVSNNLFSQNFIPFFTLKILEDHPLLWEFNSDRVYLEIENYFDSAPDFQIALKDQIYMGSKGWIDYYLVFGNSLWRKRQDSLKKKNTKNLDACIPEELFSVVSRTCAAFDIRVFTKGVEKNQNSTKSSLLIFTNDFLAKDDFNLNQPYIIAESLYIGEEN